MLSRRQYFTITTIMLVLLFMFQFTGVLKDMWNEYGTNEYEESTETSLNSLLAYEGLLLCVDDDFSAEGLVETGFILYIGADTEATYAIASEWCTYTKRDCVYSTSISSYIAASSLIPEYILIDSSYLDFDLELALIQGLAEDGANIIFMNLPSVDVVKENSELLEFLGIYYVNADSVTVDSIEIEEDFFISERLLYSSDATSDDEAALCDLDMTMPWYVARKGTKVYILGMFDDDNPTNGGLSYEYYPSIVWRKSTGSSYVYAVNGDYMSSQIGLGILYAIDYESSSYSLYPIINAQNLIFTNLAGFSDEYDSYTEELYFRSQKAFFRDLVWPSIAAIWTQSGNIPTFILDPLIDYENAQNLDYDALIYYMKLIKENSGEVALGLYRGSGTNLLQKLSIDTNFFRSCLPNYTFMAVLVDADNAADFSELRDLEIFDDLKTIVYDSGQVASIVGYDSETITFQVITADGLVHTHSDDLLLKSLESCLGYSSILVDLSSALSFDEGSYTWEVLEDELTTNLLTYWEDYSAFQKTSISESDLNIRRFLTLSYSHEISSDEVITLDVSGLDQTAYFILRTHGREITDISGATYEKLSDGAYLLTITSTAVSISLNDEGSLSISY